MAYLTTEEKIKMLGNMGEKYVSNWLSREGFIVESSIDPYDRVKDLTANGLKIEVKTHVPFIKVQAFGVNPSQLNKLRNVDRLFFINVPAPSYSFKYSGWLMEVSPKSFTFNRFETNDGREMLRIPMNQDAVSPIHKIDDGILAEMMKYSRSKY
jgi:Holliday junction resolvase-like predicted endonuclease